MKIKIHPFIIRFLRKGTIVEMFYLILNNIFIFHSHRLYKSIYGSLLYRDSDTCYDYKKYLKADGKKYALVSFLRFPLYKENYIGPLKFYFSTNGLLLTWVKVLNQLGYIVDVIDIDNESFIPKREYGVWIQHGALNYRHLQKLLPESQLIAYDTGVYWKVFNKKETERFDAFEKRVGFRPEYDRLIKNGTDYDLLYDNAKTIISLGENYTHESFKDTPYSKKLSTLPNAVYLDPKHSAVHRHRQLVSTKRNFVYFSGGGIIHKGLDLVIEVFSRNKNYNLYIAGEIEEPFLSLYKEQLILPNIHQVGFLKQRTKEFYRVISQCIFNITPSAGEGSPGGVIDMLQYGIIPIVSYESNIDVRGFGFTLENVSIEEIEKTIKMVSTLPDETLKRYSATAIEKSKTTYSPDSHENNLRDILGKILK